MEAGAQEALNGRSTICAECDDDIHKLTGHLPGNTRSQERFDLNVHVPSH